MEKHWPDSAALNESGTLQIGGCDLADLAAEFGTPLYVYDEDTIRAQCRAYRHTLATAYAGPGRLFYAAKALLNTAIAQLVVSEGFGVDVASAGELYIARHAGVRGELLAYHGVSKSLDELRFALQTRVGRLIADGLDELDSLASLSRSIEHTQEISLRVVPEVNVDTHSHIQTGHRESKFGFRMQQIPQAAQKVLAAPRLRLNGLHFHLGSQISNLVPFAAAIQRCVEVAVGLKRNFGIDIEELCVGGGLGENYVGTDAVPGIKTWTEGVSGMLTHACSKAQFPLPALSLEPGRSITARAGVALYRVVARKTDPSGSTDGHLPFVLVDGGMADNIRPSLYGARYSAMLVETAGRSLEQTVCVAGRYCESGDILITETRLSRLPEIGALLAVPVAGAYTLSMSSNYNGALKPAVVLVARGRSQTIQSRQIPSDLVSHDKPLAG